MDTALWSLFIMSALWAASISASAPSFALPGFSRQTGAECSSCHIGYSELTAKGRYFKLSGYTLGNPFPWDCWRHRQRKKAGASHAYGTRYPHALLRECTLPSPYRDVDFEAERD